MRRKEFLQEFLGALGAEEIEWINETPEEITGRVIYEKNDPEETQEFIWHKKETEVPDQQVLFLLKLIRKYVLLSIDQLMVTRDELREKFNAEYTLQSTEHEFDNLLETLEDIEVPMVDEGKETDAYFIHE